MPYFPITKVILSLHSLINTVVSFYPQLNICYNMTLNVAGLGTTP